jgi:phosphoglycolate phosphatase
MPSRGLNEEGTESDTGSLPGSDASRGIQTTADVRAQTWAPDSNLVGSPVHDLIIFDLDGTLCDPIEGISGCINYALERAGFDTVAPRQVADLIGPPLNVAFESILGTDCVELVDRLIDLYRERYSEVGYSECQLYPGVCAALESLAVAGVPLAVCTSKRTDFAARILDLFQLGELFRFVDGGNIRQSKTDQLQRLRAEGRVSANSVMIGDRAVDLIAAHRNGLPAGGVLWGYGSKIELQGQKPNYLFASPSEWSRLRKNSGHAGKIAIEA